MVGAFGEPEDLAEPEPDLRMAAVRVLNAFNDHDLAGLAELAPAERAEHARARQYLYDYLDAMWRRSRAESVDAQAAVDAVAAMRDLTGALWNTAENARHLAGDTAAEPMVRGS